MYCRKFGGNWPIRAELNSIRFCGGRPLSVYLLAGIISLIAVLLNVYHELLEHQGSLPVTILNLAAFGALMASAWRAVRERRDYQREKDAAVAMARENDGALQRLIEQFPCVVVAISPDFTVQRTNRMLETVTGYGVDQTVGRKCYQLFGPGRICDGCPVQKALATGQVQQNLKREITLGGREIVIEQTAIPVVGPDGKIRHVLEIVFDATRRTMLEQENRDLFIQTVGALASLIDRRDTATGRHSAGVRDIAVRIGRRLDLTPETIEEIDVAALLHDIGKIGVAETILNKPGRLTEAEYAVIRQHPEIGYNTLGTIKPLTKIAEYILHHHERYDGTGYPAGRGGEDIPLVARILCVADVFEAVTADRVYRPAMDFDQAMEVMAAGRGGLFDPVVLDAFFADVRERGGAAAAALERVEANWQRQ